jgi:hypothetical protein
MAGLDPAISIIGHCAFLSEIAGSSPAMTMQLDCIILAARTTPGTTFTEK